MKLSSLVAELIATFTLTFGVLLSLNGQISIATPIIAALILGLFVFTIGSISGAHLNPAITIGLLSTRQITAKKAAGYIIMQILGAIAALLVVKSMFTLPEVVALESWKIVLGEFLGTFFLAWGVMSVVKKQNGDSASGLTIGGSLFLGILIASTMSNGVLNPAVALGIGSVSFSYILAPIAGSLAAMLLYNHLVNCDICLMKDKK